MAPQSVLQTLLFSTCLNSATSQKARKSPTAIFLSFAMLQFPLSLTSVSGTRLWSRCPQSSAVPRRWNRTKQRWPWTSARQCRSTTCASLPCPRPLCNRLRYSPPCPNSLPVHVCVQAPQFPFWLLFLIVCCGWYVFNEGLPVSVSSNAQPQRADSKLKHQK